MPRFRRNPRTRVLEAKAPDENTALAWCSKARKGGYGVELEGETQANFLVSPKKGPNVICGLPRK